MLRVSVITIGLLLLLGTVSRSHAAPEGPRVHDGPARHPTLEMDLPAADAAQVAEDAGTTVGLAAFSRYDALVASLTIFVLAIFVGFEVITKVPPTLHTPLMSGSNAISGITIVGALIAAGKGLSVASWLGMLAVLLATINVVGGFMVTGRMLAMFQKKKD
jgi:NAD(P) transhydrogenase subunit alpha